MDRIEQLLADALNSYASFVVSRFHNEWSSDTVQRNKVLAELHQEQLLSEVRALVG